MAGIGAGIGPAIVLSAVGTHGGAIAFLDRPGAGAHRRITLPLV